MLVQQDPPSCHTHESFTQLCWLPLGYQSKNAADGQLHTETCGKEVLRCQGGLSSILSSKPCMTKQSRPCGPAQAAWGRSHELQSASKREHANHLGPCCRPEGSCRVGGLMSCPALQIAGACPAICIGVPRLPRDC